MTEKCRKGYRPGYLYETVAGMYLLFVGLVNLEYWALVLHVRQTNPGVGGDISSAILWALVIVMAVISFGGLYMVIRGIVNEVRYVKSEKSH